MDNLASRAFRKLSPAQSAVLAVMEIDRYVRRQLPRTPGPLAANLNAVLWSAIQANMRWPGYFPSRRRRYPRVVRRLGAADCLCPIWPRYDSQAKRSLWGQMRRQLPQSPKNHDAMGQVSRSTGFS
jgi:hypothetical protein